MLKFFAPLLDDCQVASIFYTGKTKISDEEIEEICSSCEGTMFIHTRRPEWAKVSSTHT